MQKGVLESASQLKINVYNLPEIKRKKTHFINDFLKTIAFCLQDSRRMNSILIYDLQAILTLKSTFDFMKFQLVKDWKRMALIIFFI